MYRDIEVFNAIEKERQRQQDHLELIASENIVSTQVLAAQGSVLTNKYAEGYPNRRYYRGCEHVDTIEQLAIDRVCKLFGCGYANVQPHSGAQANGAVFLACLQPGDTFMGMSLAAGGNLTHGASVTVSGKWFNAVGYDLDPQTCQLDYERIGDLARTHKPKLIIAGGSSYARIIDFAKFRAIADEVGAILMVDMAHFAGLVAGGVYPSPFPHAHVVTSTTHKTLRGPRGGIILTNDSDMAKKINSAVFPGLQGGPLMHVIAAKAVAFGEALEPEFQEYARNVVDNAHALAKTMVEHGLNLVSGGTDSHLLMVDLRGTGVTGEQAAAWLESVHMVCNRNSVPNDPLPPNTTSGIRIGTPACTTRGFSTREFIKVGEWIAKGIKAIEKGQAEQLAKQIAPEVAKLAAQFPIYPTIPGYFK